MVIDDGEDCKKHNNSSLLLRSFHFMGLVVGSAIFVFQVVVSIKIIRFEKCFVYCTK